MHPDDEVLARIEHVGFGTGDIGRSCLWFTTYVSESLAATQCFTDWKEIDHLVRGAPGDDVHSLEGYLCWVRQESSFIRFVRLWKGKPFVEEVPA